MKPSIVTDRLLYWWRWVWIVPEVGDWRGWSMTALVRVPVAVSSVFVIMGAFVLATPFGLGFARGNTRTNSGLLLAYVLILAVGYATIIVEWFERKSALARGAVPYATIKVKPDGVQVGFKNQRLLIPWNAIGGAQSGDEGFELRWGTDGRLFGVHVSPSQSTLLPSGELPNDVSMAAWINERKAEFDAVGRT